jgi:CRISPR/Cas system-associated endoribonuclease Cas2
MFRLRIAVTLMALSLLGAAFMQGKSDEKTPVKPKGVLPANFKKLGLTDVQRDKIYILQAEYKAKADDLRKQLEKLRAEERDSIEKVLTPEQLKRLKEIRSGEKPKEQDKGSTKDKDKAKDKDKD